MQCEIVLTETAQTEIGTIRYSVIREEKGCGPEDEFLPYGLLVCSAAELSLLRQLCADVGQAAAWCRLLAVYAVRPCHVADVLSDRISES